MSRLNKQISPSLLAGAVGLLLLVGLLFTSAQPTIDIHGADSKIIFTADTGLVWLPGDCLTVRWKVEGIREVYLNDQGQVGEGQREICLDSQTMPSLRVKLLDDSTQVYTLPITILLIHPLFWLSLVLVAWALIARRSALLSAAARSRKTLSQSAFLRELPKRLALLALGIIFAGILLEGGLRFYYSRYGSREDRIRYLMTREEILNLDNILVPMPYVNYVPSPAYPEHNSLGYRGPEIELPKPAGIYRIVALGGSTTYSTATSYANSYPAQLQNILRNDYGYEKVEVINGGFIGYTSWETLANFEFRVLELEPDMIILYEGVNDIAPREQISVDCYRGHNVLRGLNPARGFWIERDTPLSPSALYRLIAITLGWMPDPSKINSAFELPKANCQLDDLPVEQRVADNPPVYFERNLRSILAIAQTNNVQAVLSTWAYYLDQERPAYWREAVSENNTIIKNLAQAMDVPLYDLMTNMPVNPAYWGSDGIHMFPPGAHEQAKEYAAFLAEQGLLPK